MGNKMRKLALLGKQLGHTFSPRYFADKFEREGISGVEYGTMELEKIDEFLDAIARRPDLVGMNVTIPYKTAVMDYLDDLDETADRIGAVNTIRFGKDGLKGYNTDAIGFQRTLEGFIPMGFSGKALILGTGGSSKAVRFVLEKLNIPFKFISRTARENGFSYEEVNESVMMEHTLIVNTTPLGMYPNVSAAPDLPYDFIGEQHYLYDLIYNPEETLFMKKGKLRGATVINGYAMLIQQAEAAWEIWNIEDE